MPRLLLPAALLVALLLGGVLLGWAARRRQGSGTYPSRRTRPAELERAWSAWEARDLARLGRLTAARTATASARPRSPAERAEWALLQALASGDQAEIEAVARRWPGSSAAAVAAWTLITRAGDEAERTLRVEAFRRVWPRAWVLPAPEGGR